MLFVFLRVTSEQNLSYFVFISIFANFSKTINVKKVQTMVSSKIVFK